MNISIISVPMVRKIMSTIAVFAMVFSPFTSLVPVVNADHDAGTPYEGEILGKKNDSDLVTIESIRICHSTKSESNPYSNPEVNISSFFSGGHDTELDDIIPPFHYIEEKDGPVLSFLGMNWENEDAVATWENGCVPVVETGNVTITKEVNDTPDPNVTFSFESTFPVEGDFNLDGGESTTFQAQDAGTYTVTETNIPLGWTLDSISCDSQSGWSVEGDELSITLEGGENLTCTFSNVTEVVDVCPNIPEAQSTVPAGMVIDNAGNCVTPEEDVATIVAHKIVCTNEADLPNWGAAGGPHITASTANDWVNTHQSCALTSGWDFEWVLNSEQTDPGDTLTTTAGGNWTTFGSTDPNGMVSVDLTAGDLGDESIVWLREVLKDGYIPFTHEASPNNSNNVSAEFYCHTDVINYDNLDWIGGIELGNTYHCVAWNVAEPVYGCMDSTATNYNPLATVDDESCTYPEIPLCQTDANLLLNGDFETPIVTNQAKWDIFSNGIDWTVTWIDGAITAVPALELHRGVNGWLPFEGAQYAELDSDQGGPSSNVSGESASIRIEQTVPTIPGATYKLQYRFSPRPDKVSATENVLKSFVDAVVDIVTGDGTPMTNTEWDLVERTFVADGATTVIAFEDGGVSNSAGTFLDDACLLKISDPEPTRTTLTVNKVVTNDFGGSAVASDFSFTFDGVSYPFEADGSNEIVITTPGTYSVVEDANTLGYEASHALSCTDVNVVLGQSYSCEITNTQLPACRDGIDNDQDGIIDFVNGEPGCTDGDDNSEEDPVASITLDKVVVGEGADPEQIFTFGTWENKATLMTANSAPVVFDNLDGGLGKSYFISEFNIPDRWELESVVCTDITNPNAPEAENITEGNGGYYINLSAGEDVSCVFTNLYTPRDSSSDSEHIVVRKEVTEGSDIRTAFTFNPSWSDADFELIANSQVTSGDLFLDTVYSVTETLPEYWSLENASCVSSALPTAVIDPSNIILTVDGETITCTFTNDQELFQIYGYVWHDANDNHEWEGFNSESQEEEYTEDDLSGWTVSITNGVDTFSTTTDENGYYEFNVPAGTWTITEAVQNSWAQTFPDAGTHVVTVPELYVVTAESESVLATLFDLFVPTAHAQAAYATVYGAFNFGNKQVPQIIVTTSGGGGGGSPSPRCDAFDLDGEVLSWKTRNGYDLAITRNGDEIFSTKDDDETDEGSTDTESAPGDVFELTVNRGSKDDTCVIEIPDGEVLGEATSIMPVGAPDTGRGGTSPLFVTLSSLQAILMNGVTTKKAKNAN